MYVASLRPVSCRLRNLTNFKSLSTSFTRLNSGSVLNVNTNVAKDVILYKYDNPKYFKYLSLFGLSQCGFWLYLSHFAYTTLRDAPVPEEDIEKLPWWRRINLGEQKYRNGITLATATLGYMFLTISYFYTVRSVRYLILRKGGKSLSFVTYGPFGTKNYIMDVPLKYVSASQNRTNAKTQLPIKIKGKWFYFMLDMKGEFRNPTLFDTTAGLQRNFS